MENLYYEQMRKKSRCQEVEPSQTGVPILGDLWSVEGSLAVSVSSSHPFACPLYPLSCFITPHPANLYPEEQVSGNSWDSLPLGMRKHRDHTGV